MRYLLLLEDFNKATYIKYDKNQMEDFFINTLDKGAKMPFMNDSFIINDEEYSDNEYFLGDHSSQDTRSKLRSPSVKKYVKYDIYMYLPLSGVSSFDFNDIDIFQSLLSDLKSMKKRSDFDIIKWKIKNAEINEYDVHNDNYYNVQIQLYKEISDKNFNRHFLKGEYDRLKNQTPDILNKIHATIVSNLTPVAKSNMIVPVLMDYNSGYMIFSFESLPKSTIALSNKIKKAISTKKIFSSRVTNIEYLNKIVEFTGIFNKDSIKSLDIDLNNLIFQKDIYKLNENANNFIVVKLDLKNIEKLKKEYIKINF